MKIYCKHTDITRIDELEEHPSNPNTHPAFQIELLARIIKKHGWRRPIVVSERTGKKVIIKGHGRFEAAKYLCLDEVPVDIQTYESEQDELQDLVADNRLAELVEVDMEKLREAFSDVDTAHFETGYSEGEIESIINSISIEKNDLVLEREVDSDPQDSKGQHSLVLHYMYEEAEVLIPMLEALSKIYKCRNNSSTILTLIKKHIND